MKNKTKIILITAIALVIFAISFSVYAFILTPSPEEFVLDYLNTRYTDTDYINIEEKAELQKAFLADELIEADFKFGNFNEEITYFNERKYIIESAEFNIYDVAKQEDIYNVFVKIYFNVKSDNVEEWSQLSYYDLNVVLHKDKGNLVIKDIIVLDSKYQVPDVVNDYVHD